MAAEEKSKCDIDPVCQMELKDIHGKYMYDFEDAVYYFCSEMCKDKFTAEPGKYVKKEKS